MSERYPLVAPTAAEAHAYLRGLLPRGAVWEIVGDRFDEFLRGLAEELARFLARSVALAAEFRPTRASETLDAWEGAFGLPDNGAPLPSTDDERRAALAAKVFARGGQTPAYLVAVCAAAGVEVTLVEQPYGRPFVAGLSACGDALNAHGHAFTFQLTAPAATSAGDRARLEALIAAVKPSRCRAVWAWTA